MRPTAAQVIDIFQQIIDLLGFDAFMHQGWAQYYSGPDDDILRELFGRNPARLGRIKEKKSNNIRSYHQSKRLSAVRLDESKIGKIIDGMRIYEFFIGTYFPDVKAGVHEADEVMRFLSREYARSTFGHVVTAVCGGREDRVFRDTELPILMDNMRIETINGVPHATFRAIYESMPRTPEIAAYKTFRLICLSELRAARQHAFDDKGDGAVYDYLDRLDFYRLSRRQYLTASISIGSLPMIYRLPVAERRMRRSIFKLDVLAGRPVRPSIVLRPTRRSKRAIP